MYFGFMRPMFVGSWGANSTKGQAPGGIFYYPIISSTLVGFQKDFQEWLDPPRRVADLEKQTSKDSDPFWANMMVLTLSDNVSTHLVRILKRQGFQVRQADISMAKCWHMRQPYVLLCPLCRGFTWRCWGKFARQRWHSLSWTKGVNTFSVGCWHMVLNKSQPKTVQT